jgi:hypothetical protein
MQKVLLNIDTGNPQLVEAPVPSLQPGNVLIRTQCRLISAGSERTLIDFGRDCKYQVQLYQIARLF